MSFIENLIEQVTNEIEKNKPEKRHAKTLWITRGFLHTINALLLKENPQLDTYQALDELAILLKRFTIYCRDYPNSRY